MFRKMLISIINFVFLFFKIDDKKIVFESGRDKVDGNPLAIYQYIKNNCPNDFKTVWIVSKNTDISSLKEDDYVFYHKFISLFHLATAKYWIRSQSLGNLIIKKKNQIYIQVWHGGGAFKKCGYDIEKTNKKEPLEHVKKWDYYIATDSYNAMMIQSSTGYNKKTLTLGSCRTDSFLDFDKEKINKIFKSLNLKKNKKKIVLYAPTFRDEDLKLNKINIPIMKLRENSNILVLIRLHPLMKNLIDNEQLPKNFVNVCDYPDIQDLLLISDILITDYSSSIFDFALLNKPIIFYAYDYDSYLKERGGFYLDYKKDLPGPIAYSEDDLALLLENTNSLAKYNDKMKKFNEKYNYLNDGHVCERLIGIIKNSRL